MFRVTDKYTDEVEVYSTRQEAEFYVRVGVMFMNSQPERFGVTKRVTKRDFTIEEVQ